MYDEKRREQFLENRERRSKTITFLGIEPGLTGDELSNTKDKKIKLIIELLKDKTLRLDRRRIDGSLDINFREQMAHLIEDIHFGRFAGQSGRPSNKERGVPLKNEIEIGKLNRQLQEEGVIVAQKRYEAIEAAGLGSITHIKKCIKAYEKGMATDFEQVIDDAFAKATTKTYKADYRIVKD